VSWWGGVELVKFTREAGFLEPDVRRAITVAFAATRWADHYESSNAGARGSTRYGLWALDPTEAPVDRPRDLFDPRVAARATYELWRVHGKVWDWHPTVSQFSGLAVRQAWRTIDEYSLLTRTAAQMRGVSMAIGAASERRGVHGIMADAGPIGPLS
jgi:hypothetical protein